ncbi:MAG: prepilin peptidase [Pseudolysinimonas sp.]
MNPRWSSSREAACRDRSLAEERAKLASRSRMLRWTWQLPLALALAALAIAALGFTPAAIAAVYLAAVTPELVRIDLSEHRLPNRMVVPGIAVGLVTAGLSWVLRGEPPLIPLVAALATAGLLALLALGGGIGMGDVKLAALIGLASPTIAIAPVAPLAAFLLGGVAASIVLVRGVVAGRGREARRTHLAFGPFLLAGYFVALAPACVGWAS